MNNDINPNDLPQQNFEKKEIYQHPQPPGHGKPLNTKNKSSILSHNNKESDRTVKHEGLNEENFNGNVEE